jgi:tetratricopeptide (TPR) repeat protein
VRGYTRGDAARICGVSAARLRYWERTALLEPTLRRGTERAFGFGDLVSVKKLRVLLEHGVPLRRIRRSMQDLRRRVPELEQPLGALRVWAEGSSRVVVRHDGVLLEPDGQTVLDFVGAGVGNAVAPLAGRRHAAEPSALSQQRALEWFERGCKLDSDRATHGDAIDAYERALRADPGFADAHCNLGSVYFNQDRRTTAKACFERAIEIEPHHVEAHLNLASLLEDEGHHPSALGHYKAALEVDPLQPDIRVSLALLFDKLGLARKAREQWRRYLQLDPAGSWADLAHRRLTD